MNPAEHYFEAARDYWSFCYWADPAHQHTTDVATLNWPQERLHAGCDHVLADRRRISLEIHPPSEYYTEIDREHWAGKTVLEFGCGMGVDAYQLARRGAIVTATDIVPSNVVVADKVLSGWPHSTLVLQTYDALDTLGQFDAVLSSGCLHHLRPPLDEIAMAKLVARLKPTGRMYLMLYSKHYYPEPKLNAEGPYTRGFDEAETAVLLGPKMQMFSYRYILGFTCAWVVAHPREEVV